MMFIFPSYLPMLISAAVIKQNKSKHMQPRMPKTWKSNAYATLTSGLIFITFGT